MLNGFKSGFVLSRTMGLTTMIWLVWQNLFKPVSRDSADFLFTFYSAAKTVTEGHFADLYPSLTADSFLGSSFDKFTHLLLPSVDPTIVAAFHEAPLLALILTVFTFVPITAALFVWQTISIFALYISSRLGSTFSSAKAKEIFWFSFVFFPIFHLLTIGQIGLVFGLLPLFAGYFFLKQKKDLLAGLIWSITFFKPQYLVPVGILALIFFLAARRKVLAGLAIGLITIQIASLALIPPAITQAWFHSIKLSENVFYNAAYGIPSFMVTSLSSVLLVYTPMAYKEFVHLPIYAIVLAIAGYSFFQCYAAAKKGLNDSTLDWLAIIVITITPLIAPYLLFYDLVMLILPGVLIFANADATFAENKTKLLAKVLWIATNIYLVLIAFFPQSPVTQPLVFMLVYAEIYRRLLIQFVNTNIRKQAK